MMRTGHLHAFWETGVEGVHWVVFDLDAPRREMMHVLQTGDRLIVRSKAGEVLFDGVIQLDFDACKEPAPFNPRFQIQRVDGAWVSGVQAGVDPKVWVRWFCDELPCEFVPARPKT